MGYSKKPNFKSVLAFEARQLTVCMETLAEQQRLLESVRAALPTEISGHVMHCVSNATRLLIYTDSATWASQIRFFHQSILNKLQQSGQQNIAKLQVKVMPPRSEPITERTARLPSAETVRLILGQVDDKSNDVLDLALSRLAKTLGKRLQTDKD